MKVRIKFSKQGDVKFIGHLDIMRYFQKAMRRAEIDIAYSQGFSPHQIMSFAAPLGVGLTSLGEYMDVELVSMESTSQVKEALNQVMVDGIEVVEVTVLPEKAMNAMASVAADRYRVGFRPGYEPEFAWQDGLLEFVKKDQILVTKQTKKSELELDLAPSIYEFEIHDEEVVMLINASSSGNIKPGMVMKAYFDTTDYEWSDFSLIIERIDTYRAMEKDGNVCYVPLNYFE